jgi:AAHS family 3-hydroxyphenylpropionic acid transporter
MLLSIIQNWLPLLLVGKGLAGREAAATQIAFNVAGALGATTAGYMIAGTRKALVPIVAFAMLLVATTLVAALSMPGPLIFASLTLGFGMLAVQSILYGLTPSCYAEAIRGTGVGAAVAVGRAGSVLGPLLAAAVIALGFTSSQLLMMLVPIIAAAGVGTLLLTRRIAARS